MSRTRIYTNDTINIMLRFFEAVRIISSMNLIHSPRAYCIRYKINYKRYNNQRYNINKGSFEISWILPLIEDFDISYKWLLFGKGNVFRLDKMNDSMQIICNPKELKNITANNLNKYDVVKI